MKILLDYLFPITAIDPTPAASTAFLKQVCVIGKPKNGGVTAGTIVSCSTIAAVQALLGTQASLEVAELFNAGMAKVFVLPMNDLDMSAELVGHESDFYTILITSDFSDADVVEAQAAGTITISSYANLLTSSPDTISVAGQAFTAQAGAATLGAATFQAATSNNATAASLAAQINAHAVTKALVTAAVDPNNLSHVIVTAILNGAGGNAIALVYTDNGGGNVGASLSGATLAGGAGLELGAFKGVTGVSSDEDAYLALQAVKTNRCAFYVADSNGAKNMFYAFGKLLSNALDWKNQQYVTVPYADDIGTLGDAETLFDDRISFVIDDDEFASRLAFFACGGKAIVAPYIARNLEIDQQSKALQYISANEPGYTKTQAALLEDELQKVIDGYVKDKGWIDAGTIAVTLEEDNFVASGSINIAEPKALWRIFGEMRQTL